MHYFENVFVLINQKMNDLFNSPRRNDVKGKMEHIIKSIKTGALIYFYNLSIVIQSNEVET